MADQVHEQMRQEAQEEDRHIPAKLFSFIQKPQYKTFLQTLLEYCKELFRLENKQQVLEQEARQRGLPVPQVLPSEKKKLNEKATKMANAYSWIIYMNKSVSDERIQKLASFLEFKSNIVANQRADQKFYDSLIIFSAKVLKDAFEASELMKLEEEINRLYRSNAFNITERKLHKESLERQYPQLRDINMKDLDSSDKKKVQELHRHLLLRQKVPK